MKTLPLQFEPISFPPIDEIFKQMFGKKPTPAEIEAARRADEENEVEIDAAFADDDDDFDPNYDDELPHPYFDGR